MYTVHNTTVYTPSAWLEEVNAGGFEPKLLSMIYSRGSPRFRTPLRCDPYMSPQDSYKSNNRTYVKHSGDQG